MENKKEISDKNVEDISNESTSEKEKITSPSFSSSYIKSYSQTTVESTILDYTWKIDEFSRVARAHHTLISPLFSDKGQYKMRIQANFGLSGQSCSIKLYTITSNEFYSSCNVTIEYKTVLLDELVWRRLSNMELLIEVPKFVLKSVNCKDALIAHCKFEIFHGLVHDTIHMKLLPLSTVFLNNAKYEDSMFDDIQSTVEESITFIIKNEKHIISKKLLCATNSTYFKQCITNGGKETDMTNVLQPNEYLAFKQILLYIKTGSIYEIQDNVDKLKQLFLTAVKFDVPALRLTCEHYLLRHITIDEAESFFKLASKYKAKFLEAHLTALIKFHAKKKIADTKEFQDLPEIDSSKKIKLSKES